MNWVTNRCLLLSQQLLHDVLTNGRKNDRGGDYGIWVIVSMGRIIPSRQGIRSAIITPCAVCDSKLKSGEE